MNIYQILFITIIGIVVNFAAWRAIKDELGSDAPHDNTGYAGFITAIALIMDFILLIGVLAYVGTWVVKFFIFLGTL